MERTSEWKIVERNTIERELKGAEYLINFTEEIQNGNYQLVFNVTLEGTISHDDLKKRFQSAFLRLRKKFPLLGVELDMEGMATFHALQTCESAKEWLEEVTEIIQAPPNTITREIAKKVAEQPLATVNRMSKAYLVLGPGKHQSGLIIHSSHALTGHYGIQVMDNFVKNLVEIDSERAKIEDTFDPEICSELLSRLPGSLEKAYYDKFKPTEKDMEHQASLRQELNELEKKPRIGVPILTDENDEERTSITQNLYLYYSQKESSAILQSIKQAGLSPTTAFYSSIICAIATIYAKPGETVDGCMLNFSTHASRYVPCEGQTGLPDIGMAIVPSSIWLEIADEELRMPLTKDTLIKFAKQIGEKQKTSLSSPHLISFATETVKMLKNGESPLPQEEPKISNAILTSQGVLKISEGHKNAKGSIDILDYHCFGRNTDPTVCFAICTLRGTLRISSLFDEKFFDMEEMKRLFNTSIQFLHSLQQPSNPAFAINNSRDAHL